MKASDFIPLDSSDLTDDEAFVVSGFGFGNLRRDLHRGREQPEPLTGG